MYLDHIVHFIDETPKQAVEYWNQLEFQAVQGGRHIKWGTHNALFYAKDWYIEWLALEKLEIAVQADHPLTKLFLYDRLGFGAICLRTNAIDQLDLQLKKDGFKTTGVLEAERRTNEGKLIQWKMLFIEETVSNQLPSPFFIEWQENETNRLENLRKSGVLKLENEKLELEKCVFGVHDVAASTEKWEKLLGGSLKLENCQIEFRLTEREKERLEVVVFKEAEQEVSYAQGVYRMPRRGNNKDN